MNWAIEAAGLGKRYGTVRALDGVSVSVPAGRVVGLLGHNGAGKSTLIKIILGLVRPTCGEIKSLGGHPWDKAGVELRRRSGFLPENVAFYPNLSGFEVMDYFRRLKRAPRSQSRQLLERVGLAPAARRRVGTYSKGMRQRLGLAQALLGSPELVVLDEPTSGLDPAGTREFYAIVEELRAAGKSVVISSHLLAELELRIDTALILRHGRLLAAGGLDELRNRFGLPGVVQIRLAASVRAAEFARELADLDGACRICSDSQLEIRVSAGERLALLRRLALHPAVADLGARDASLASLYEYLGAGGERPEAARA